MAPPHGRLSVVLAFVLTSISTLVVVLRFYTRHWLVGKLTASDWVILLALIATWLSVVINFYMVHFMEYSPAELQNPETQKKVIVGSLLSIWLYRISHILDLCLIKTSILLFYHHIAASNRRFHYTIRTLLAIIILGGISMFFASIFMCYPVSDAWSFKVFMGGLQGTYTAHCYNPGPFWLFNAVYNLVTDIIIWTLPIVFFMNLQTIPLRRRIGLIAIFSIGVVAIIASALRLHTIVVWLSSFQQQGLNTANLLLWSQVEQHTGLIAASIPFLRPLFRRALTKGRSREQASSPRPAALLCRQAPPGCSPDMPRTPIIPSPTFSLGFNNQEFVQPRTTLAPVGLVRSSLAWESAIWDGSQARHVLSAQPVGLSPIRNSDAVGKAPVYIVEKGSPN